MYKSKSPETRYLFRLTGAGLLLVGAVAVSSCATSKSPRSLGLVITPEFGAQPPVRPSQGLSLKILGDLEALRQREPRHPVNCPDDQGELYELDFTRTAVTAQVKSDGCRNVAFDHKDLVASQQLLQDINTAVNNPQ